ncbi:tetratricopeptide repeat protein [Clostridium rectalis]|uniref:tetratricopeptide repeat protein n=1 Tax=Clostridium rectalis TaxID=2040295 RepID=UPI000F637C95|nr:tetratricopeptide repeat protein [Clostridium rectalis]
MNKPKRLDIAKYKFPIIIGIVIIILLAGFIYTKTNKNKKYNIEKNKGEQYFLKSDFNKSIEEFEKLYSEDKSLLWKAKIAQIYSVKGDIENSKKYIEEIKKSKDKNSEVLNYIVFTEYMNKDYATALKDGNEALKIYPKDKSLVKTMFAVYMANSQYEQAKKLIQTYPVDEGSAYDMAEYGRMLILIGDNVNGYEKLRKAWDLDKDEYKIYDSLVQMSLYDKNKLLEDISVLSKKNPQDVAYKMWLAKIYSMSVDTISQADKILGEIKDKDLGKIEKYVIEYYIYEGTNEKDKAEAIISKLVSDNKDDYRVLHTVAWYYLHKKDLGKAREFAEKSIYENQNYVDNYAFLMPDILKAENKGVEGEPYFRIALLKEPYNYNIILYIAEYYLSTANNSNKALEYFKLAEIIRPLDTEIKYNIALIHLSNKKDDEAIKILKKAIDIQNDVPKYHRTLGTVYFLHGKYENALAEIKDAYDADKDDMLTLNNAGCYYVMVSSELEKGVENLKSAYDKIDKNTGEYTRKTITENYEKAKKLLDAYNNAKGNEKLPVPELTLFY